MNGEKRSYTKSNVLYLIDVPIESNNISKMFFHFKRYGRIKSIWCDGTRASVVFETQEEAETAFKSPEAYGNNRFVKYRYHRDPEHAEANLHSLCDAQSVNAAIEEAKRQIDEAQQRTKDIINELNQKKQEQVDEAQLAKDAAAEQSPQSPKQQDISEYREMRRKTQTIYNNFVKEIEAHDPSAPDYQEKLEGKKEVERILEQLNREIAKMEEEEKVNEAIK